MQAELLKHLNYLTAIRPFRNWTNKTSINTSKDYIAKEFAAYGLPVTLQKWKVGTLAFENVVASYQPNKATKLIVGAHYDVYSNQPGADDNTSGVAGLLWLAKEIARLKPDLPYGIEFVSYCLEEPPNFGTKNMGSYIHAESLKNNNTPVIGMVCLDMIGYFSDAENSQNYPLPQFSEIYPTVGNFIAAIGIEKHADFSTIVATKMKEANTIPVELINFPANVNLAGLSDHRNYWYFGYDAVMINDTAKYRNPNYHEITDTVDTLDLGKMQGVLMALLHVLKNPISNTAKLGETPVKEADSPNPPTTESSESKSFFAMLLRWLKKLLGRK